jgi:regulator of replication initiation timing
LAKECEVLEQKLEEDMAATVKVQISFESLIEAIGSLDLEAKLQLREILEDQIFEAEEDMENDPDVLAEVEEARKEYQAGNYRTIEEYTASRSDQAS